MDAKHFAAVDRPPARERSAGEWLRQFADGWPALVAFLVLGLALALAYTATQKRQYQAQDSVIISPAHGFLDPNYAENFSIVTAMIGRMADTQSFLTRIASVYAHSAPTRASAQRRLAQATPKWLEAHFSATPYADSSLLTVSATTGSASDSRQLAAAAANGITALVNVAEANSQGRRAHRPFTAGLTLVSSDVTGNGQTSPTLKRNLLIGGDIGLLLGIVAALFFGGWRDRLWKPIDLERTLGRLTVGRLRRRRGALVDAGGLDKVVAELEFGQIASEGPHVVVVTGPASVMEIAGVAHELAQATESVLERSEGETRRAVLVNAARGDEAIQRPASLDRQSENDEPAVDGIALDPQRLRTSLATCERASEHVVAAGPRTTGKPSREVDSLVRTSDRVVLVVRRGTSSRVVLRIIDSSVMMHRRTAAVVLLG